MGEKEDQAGNAPASMATYTESFFGIKMLLIEPAGIKTEFVNRVLTDLKLQKPIRAEQLGLDG